VGAKPIEGQERSTSVLERVQDPLEKLDPARTSLDGIANSNHQAALVVYRAPTLALPSGDLPEPTRHSREHTARLESASVLDAPASMTESVSPPARDRGSWAMRAWVAAMVTIIGAAGVVALREGRAASEPSAEARAPAEASPPAAAVVDPGMAAAAGSVPALPGASSSSVSTPDTQLDPAAEARRARRAARKEAAEQAAAEAAAAVADPSARAAKPASEPEANGSSAPAPSGQAAEAPAGNSGTEATPSPAAPREVPGTPQAAPPIPSNPYAGEEDGA